MPGAGIVGETIQFHGAADRYTLAGATSVATLYSNATTATSNPAVTTRNVGSSGGQAAAFTYDLSRSVVLTRQGNPAWAGQDRDGAFGTAEIMSTDLFFGAAPGDVQPDWVNLDKVAIPQADEQQRLLANLVVLMSRDRTPTPRFWYLPRGEKAAVVMTGDDHGTGHDRGRASRPLQGAEPGRLLGGPLGVRAGDLVHVPGHPDHECPGGRLRRGRLRGRAPPQRRLRVQQPDRPPRSRLSTRFSWASSPPSTRACPIPRPRASTASPGPTGCRTPGSSWQHGIRFDTNYYYFPPEWIGNRPGWWTGSGFPMRFADEDGTTRRHLPGGQPAGRRDDR